MAEDLSWMEDDYVVREYPIHLCNDLKESGAQLVLCQYPLRAPWRNYETEDATVARFKEKAQRLEVDIPVDAGNENYNAEVPRARRIEQLTLRSQHQPSMSDSFAIGRFIGNTLVLIPIDATYTMRPSMQYLQKEEKVKGEGGESDEDMADAAADGDAAAAGPSGASSSGLTAVEVTVKRRETERQLQARMNSYAFLQQQEADEPWIELKPQGESSQSASIYWNIVIASAARGAAAAAAAANAAGDAEALKAALATFGPVPTLLTPSEYLAAIMPGSMGQGPAAGGGAAAGTAFYGGGGAAGASGSGTAAAAGGQGAGGEGAGLPTLTEELKQKVAPVLKNLFKQHSVCNIADVRRWFRERTSGLVSTASNLEEKVLHELVQSVVDVAVIRRTYVLRATGSAATDPLRALLVALLQDNDSLQKRDISAEAEARGLKVNDHTYSKVIKDLCISHSNNWSLKPGANF